MIAVTKKYKNCNFLPLNGIKSKIKELKESEFKGKVVKQKIVISAVETKKNCINKIIFNF